MDSSNSGTGMKSYCFGIYYGEDYAGVGWVVYSLDGGRVYVKTALMNDVEAACCKDVKIYSCIESNQRADRL